MPVESTSEEFESEKMSSDDFKRRVSGFIVMYASFFSMPFPHFLLHKDALATTVLINVLTLCTMFDFGEKREIWASFTVLALLSVALIQGVDPAWWIVSLIAGAYFAYFSIRPPRTKSTPGARKQKQTAV